MSMKDFLIRILTRKEGTGARQAEKELAGVKEKAGGVQGKLREAEQAGQEFSNSTVGGLGRLMPKLAAGAAAIGAITFALREAGKALRAFAQQELSETDLDSALAVTGQLTERYRLQLQDLASEYQSLTAIGDDAWLKSMAMLTRFGASAANIEDVSEAVKNLAGLLDGNLNAATMLIQRALEGQFEMFTRYGIKFEQTGDQAKDLANLFELLAEKGGGLLEARAKTLTGMFDNLGNSLGDFRETMGRVISNTGIAQDIMGGLTGALNRLAEAIDPVHKRVGDLTIKFPDLSREAREAAASLEKVGETDLSNVVSNAEQLAKSLQESASAAAKILSRADELASAQLALEIAKVDEAVAHGAMSEAEGKRRKQALQRAAADEQLQRHMDDINTRRTQSLDELARLEADRAAKAEDFFAQADAVDAQIAKLREAGLVSEKEIADLQSQDQEVRQAAFTAVRNRAAEADRANERAITERMWRYFDKRGGPVDIATGKLKPIPPEIKEEYEKYSSSARALEESVSAVLGASDALERSKEQVNEFRESVAALASELAHRERMLETQHAATVTRSRTETYAVGRAEETAGLKAEREDLKRQLAEVRAELKELRETGPERVAREGSEAAAAEAELRAFEALPLSRQGRTPITRLRELQATLARERDEAAAAASGLSSLEANLENTLHGLSERINRLDQMMENTRSTLTNSL